MSLRDTIAWPDAESRTNVLIVTSGLHIGGAEVVVRDLARSLDRSRFNVSICCLSVLGVIGEALAQEGIDVFVLSEAGGVGSRYLTFLRLRRVIREKGIHIIHSHTAYSLVDSALCRATLRGVRLVHTFHFGNYPRKERRIRFMESWFSRFADQLIAVGDVQRRQVMAAYSLRPSSIRTVRNGVNRLSHDRLGAPRQGAGGQKSIVVGTLANLIEQKGLFDLVRVAAIVHAVRPEIRFVIAGEGPLRTELERAVAESGLQGVVHLKGWLENAAAVLLPSVDIYLQPSLWEAMSIAILEAMVAGKPVISTRVGEAIYMIEHDVDGILVEPRDIEGMASWVVRLADSAVWRKRLGDAAAGKVEHRFSVGHMTGAYESIYAQLAGVSKVS